MTEEEQTEPVEPSITEPTEAAESQTTESDTGNAEAKPEAIGEDFKFALPEGQEFDEKNLEDLRSFVISEKMTKESAQSLFDYMLNNRNKFDEKQKAEREKAIEENRKEIKADPDLGGANYAKIQKAVDSIALKYGGQDFKEKVAEAGLKDNILFVRFMFNLNSSLSEDAVLTTSQGSGSGPRELTEKQLADKFINN
jgi:hypothetical protein